MKKGEAKRIALGGLLAAAAVVVMCLGGMIPVATFVCPVLCIIMCGLIYGFCGGRVAWAWYGVVAIVSFLLGPDKEAAAIFAVLGYYPIVKPRIDQTRVSFLLKFLLFNVTVSILYGLMIYVLGLQEIISEYLEFGVVGLLIMILLGNLTFILVDRLLSMFSRKWRQYGR